MEKLVSSDNIKDSINRVITPQFTQLSVFIFNYNEGGVNRDLFLEYLQVDPDDFDDFSSFVQSAKKSLTIKKEDFFKVDTLLKSEQWTELWDILPYYIKNFQKIEIFFYLLERYILIEASKIDSFTQSIPNDIDIEKTLREIEESEEKIFWKKLSDRPDKAKKILDEYIIEQYNENKDALNSEEQNFIENIISKLQKKYPKETQTANQESAKNAMILKDPLQWKQGVDDSIMKKKISREKYVEIFTLCLEILWVDAKVVVWKYPNFSVTPWIPWEPWELRVPENSNYQYKDVEYIVWLISHELERHMIWNVNNKNLIGNLKSLSYLGQEEWVAHVMEHLGKWYDLDNIPLNRYLPRMLVWEIFDGETFKKFLKICNTLDNQDINVENFFKRAKRGKDFNLPGVNPKEKLYGIGALEVIDRIQWGENPLWFFLAKNGIWEQEAINKAIVWDKESLTPRTLHSKGIVLPLMLWELMRYKLLSPEESGSWLEVRGFIKYFNERYGELFQALWIDYKDFIWNHITSQKKQNVEKVAKILEIIES